MHISFKKIKTVQVEYFPSLYGIWAETKKLVFSHNKKIEQKFCFDNNCEHIR